MPLLGKRPQARQRIFVPGQRDVEIEFPGILHELLRTFPNVDRRVRQHRRGADGEIRKRAAGMGQDDLAPSVPPHDTRHYHVDGRARGLVWVVNHRLRQVRIHQPRVDGVCGVHKHDSGLGVQVPPDLFKVRVAQVVVVGAVAREERDAVGAQLVERAVDFGQGGVGVEERGQRGEEAVAAGAGVADPGGGVVDVAGEGDGVGARGDGHAWSR